MSPKVEIPCRHFSPSGAACASAGEETPMLSPSAGAMATAAVPCRRCRRVIAKCGNPVALREPASTQYKARVRQNTLLFPHVINMGTAPVRRNVPITTTRSPCANGQALPGRSRRSPCRTVGILLRRCRQRSRMFRKRVQIGDHVGALAVLLNAGESHRRTWNEALGVRDELVEIVKGPGAALGLHGSREVEPAALASRFVDDAKEVRADAVRTALFEGVAGRALLGGGGALLDGGGLQKLLDRLGGSSGFLGAAMRGVLLHGNLEAGLLQRLGRENRMSGKARHQNENAGAEESTDDLVEFEGVHSWVRLQAGKVD